MNAVAGRPYSKVQRDCPALLTESEPHFLFVTPQAPELPFRSSRCRASQFNTENAGGGARWAFKLKRLFSCFPRPVCVDENPHLAAYNAHLVSRPYLTSSSRVRMIGTRETMFNLRGGGRCNGQKPNTATRSTACETSRASSSPRGSGRGVSFFFCFFWGLARSPLAGCRAMGGSGRNHGIGGGVRRRDGDDGDPGIDAARGRGRVEGWMGIDAAWTACAARHHGDLVVLAGRSELMCAWMSRRAGVVHASRSPRSEMLRRTGGRCRRSAMVVNIDLVILEGRQCARLSRVAMRWRRWVGCGGAVRGDEVVACSARWLVLRIRAGGSVMSAYTWTRGTGGDESNSGIFSGSSCPANTGDGTRVA
ncbi:hypothetical protein B0H12DRAFT_1072473 [Mycena haematopus]|nr:hypothetical protein B0H12DRAFT_1072473 [Mycena haematopus]